ncbi:hypothetical protein BH23THE1_BH23THE1_13930 [soil metagenome]
MRQDPDSDGHSVRIELVIRSILGIASQDLTNFSHIEFYLFGLYPRRRLNLKLFDTFNHFNSFQTGLNNFQISPVFFWTGCRILFPAEFY